MEANVSSPLSLIVKHLSTIEKIDSTIFYENAIKYTDCSYNSQENKKYFESWKLSLPARLNYLADLIFHVCMLPITTLKVFFGSIQSLYSWAKDTKFLKKNINILHFHANSALADAFGIVIIKAGIVLRENNNVRDFLAIAAILSSIFLTIFAFKKGDNFKVIYDPDTNSFKPAINWKL